jgi:hypothetical protein
MTEFLKNLLITTWYKAVIAVFGAAFLVTLGQRRDELAMVFCGACLIGIGEWRNHPKKEVRLRIDSTGNKWKVTDVPRRANFVGILLQLIGVVLMLYGMYRIFGLSLPYLK